MEKCNVWTNLGDSSDHIGNMGADSSDSSNFLLLSEPLGDLKFIFLDHLEGELRVIHFGNHLLASKSELTCMSSAKCLKSRVSLPRGPTTVTVLALTLTVTPAGTLTFCETKICFILKTCVWTRAKQMCQVLTLPKIKRSLTVKYPTNE